MDGQPDDEMDRRIGNRMMTSAASSKSTCFFAPEKSEGLESSLQASVFIMAI